MTLLQDCQIEPTQSGIAIAVNGEVVPRRQWETYPLQANDVVEVVHAVAGG
jgi:sulfur carrier protein